MAYLNVAESTGLVPIFEGLTDEVRGHSLRVANMCKILLPCIKEAIAPELSFEEYNEDWFVYAACLHDVGKYQLPLELLEKKTKITAEEYLRIQQHIRIDLNLVAHTVDDWFKAAQRDSAESGTDTRADIRERLFVKDLVRCVITQHHERWDGKGYPVGLSGFDINYCARLCSIADMLDAITIERAYHKAESWESALYKMKASGGTQLDAEMVKIVTGMEDALKACTSGTLSELFSRLEMKYWYGVNNQCNNQ